MSEKRTFYQYQRREGNWNLVECFGGQTAPVDECGRTAMQAAEVVKQATDARARAALVSDLAAFVERVAGSGIVAVGTVLFCRFCDGVAEHPYSHVSDVPHTDDCLYLQAQSLLARITAAGLSGDAAASAGRSGE